MGQGGLDMTLPIMLTDEQKELICIFQVCVQLHTFFYYCPESRFNMNKRVHHKELEFTILSYSGHLENYLWSNHFRSKDEADRMMKRVNDDVIDNKKYLIPGYLSSQVKYSVSRLFDTRGVGDPEGIIAFIDGYLPFMPKDRLRDSILKIAAERGLKAY